MPWWRLRASAARRWIPRTGSKSVRVTHSSVNAGCAVERLPPRELPLPEAPDTRQWLEARMKAKWPELEAADARVGARRAELNLARRERLPEGTFGLAYDRFWSEPELRGTVGLSLNLPLNF